MKIPRLDVVFNKNLDLNANSPSFGGNLYIDDVLDVDMQTTLDVKRDTVTLKVPNRQRRKLDGTTTYSAYQNYLVPNLGSGDIVDSRSNYVFQEEDKITLYAYYDGESPGSPLFEGIIFDVDYQVDGDNGGVYDIQLANRTQELMHSQLFANYDTQALDQNDNVIVRNAADIIVRMVSQMNNLNPDAKQIDAKLVSNGGFVSETKLNGSPLLGSQIPPTANTHFVYKTGYDSMYKHIQKLAGIDYTGDTAAGQYLFYVDSNSVLHWGPRPQVVSGSIVESEQVKVSINKNTDDVVNALIINAGADPNGAGILTFVIDQQSAAEVGTRFKYVPLIRIAELIQLDERKLGAAINGSNAIPNDSKFPAGYPYTLQFNNVDFNGTEITPTTKVVTSDEEFKDAIRNYARKKAKEDGRQKIATLSQSRFDATVEFEFGRVGDVLGNQYNFIVPSYNILGTTELNTLYLRLERIQHNWNRNGWTTTLTFKEDEITTT